MGQIGRKRFLLDANLSPRIGRFLAKRHGLEIKSLLAEGLAEVDDQIVVGMAKDEDRVVVTLDRDFQTMFFKSSNWPEAGIVYLALPSRARKIANIRRILDDFFTRDAPSIDFERSLVVITDLDVIVHRAPQMN